ncbi:MAG: pyruvate, phosphate dikinase [Anaerolineaceae bacterium]|nr:pyruvate, phosphate dikinase [Anaerolineaceae bacterium]
MAKKLVYFFGGGKAEGRTEMKETLGGKGANLAEMTNIGLPVPPGFTIVTEVCDLYYKGGRKWPTGLATEIDRNIVKLEKVMGQKFGDDHDPLLVSVRSGAAVSMPGMMDTVLNLGLNEAAVQGLIAKTGNERFAWDAYRRFINMFGDVVMGIEHERFEHEMARLKKKRGVKLDTDLSAEDLKALCKAYQGVYKKHVKKAFPTDPRQQLSGAIDAVINSWHAPRAIKYRQLNNITGLLGTAVNVQTMVYGNMGDTSGTGVCFTRDPATGRNVFYGEFLMNAQGEDVVAGIRTPLPIAQLGDYLPKCHKELLKITSRLEKHYRDVQDFEFTIQEEKLYMLQTRTGKRTAAAAVKIAVDMVKEKLINKKEAVLRVEPASLDQLLHPMFDPKAPRKVIAKGLPASPGAATGKVCLTAADAELLAEMGESVLLVRHETSPEDIGGMAVANGILTSTGGMTSHAAVVARGMGKTCVAGCGALHINYKARKITAHGKTIREHDWLSLDGTTGELMEGQVPTVEPTLSKDFATLMKWADGFRKLGVRTNADTPLDAKVAREFGAEGIGLTRTEHMFFEGDRIWAVREMIMADNEAARRKALKKLLPMQRKDFEGIFKAMDGLPVTIRLLDPPLHEFLPNDDKNQKEMARRLGIKVGQVRTKVEQLHEMNPMLGFRGCRLAVVYPEIGQMQVRAIMEAACNVKKKGVKVLPEIMIPLVGVRREIETLSALAHATAKAVIKKKGVKVRYMVGTMIEIPRAALVADQIAETAEFFSFGTNDLTQMTFGYSRDDVGSFVPQYIEKEILARDPFQALDTEGVGQLVQIGIERGRKTRKNLKIGICGEHGGEPSSVEFCHRVGMNYVSCSPYRVPIARLAAAHAALKD